MMANRVNTYPEWVEKYRTKGVTIRKTKYGYGLYKCSSVYEKGRKYPKSVQEFLGMVYEDKGFMPKVTRKEYKDPVYIEYGLSSFIMKNFRRDLLRSSYDHNEQIVKLGIVEYVFKNHSLLCLRKCFLSFNDESLIEYSKTASEKRISTIATKIERSLNAKVNDIDDKKQLIALLRLCVYDAANGIKPKADEELVRLIERYGLKSW